MSQESVQRCCIVAVTGGLTLREGMYLAQELAKTGVHLALIPYLNNKLIVTGTAGNCVCVVLQAQ